MRTNRLFWLVAAAAFLVVGCQKKPPVTPDALHRAAERGDIETVQSLIASGGDINSMDRRGRTPLHRAAFQGYKDIVELLLTNGADVGARDNGGRRPLDEAARGGHQDVVDLLRAEEQVKDRK